VNKDKLWDLVIIGGGPAGSTTARFAAKNGLSVLVIDGRDSIGEPLQCGELVPSNNEMKRLCPNVPDIDELFKTISKYECATNSKLNIKKSKGLWAGRWIDNQTDFKGMEWSSDCVNLTGVYIGNRLTKDHYKRLSDLNFDEIRIKIENSLMFWKGNKLSIKGKIRVANM